MDFLPARHEYWTEVFFNIYLDYMEKKYFQRVQIPEIPSHWNALESPTLILSNHFSWWDALWIYNWNRKVLKKKFHCMVLKETLMKSPSLQKVGGYSVDPGKRSVLTTLQYSRDLLKYQENLVLIFPQGKIYSGHSTYIQFEPGLFRIIENLEKEIDILYLAGFMDHFSRKKPEVQFYLERNKTKSDNQGLEIDYNAFYSLALSKQGKRTA